MSESEEKPFLPLKAESRAMGGHLILATSQLMFHASLLLPLAFLWLVPTGDQLLNVTLRVTVVSLFVAFCCWMIPRKQAIYRRLFGNVVSEPILKQYDYRIPARPLTTSIFGELVRNWPLAVVGALMLTIVSGVVDFNHPWSGAGSSNGRSRWVGPTLEWFRLNSNTTKSLALLTGLGSLGLFGYRVLWGWRELAENVDSDEARR